MGPGFLYVGVATPSINPGCPPKSNFPDFSQTLFHVEKIGSFNQKMYFLLAINFSYFYSARKEIVTIDLNFLTFESAYDAIKTS